MLLDTDVLIDLLREIPAAEAWLNDLTSLPTISGLAALEVLFGAKNAVDMRKVQAYLTLFPILWPSESDVEATSNLAPYHLSDGLDLIDAMIAQVALRHKLTVATFNVKHFRSIPGLSTIQPYQRNQRL